MGELVVMRGGHVATDIRLGRVPQFDERSRNFPIRALLDAGAKPRSYTWRLDTHLDQDNTPFCVGFSIAHELAARPVVVTHVDTMLAVGLYKRAQQLDEWPGEDYPGSSVLGGVKAASEGGYYDEYRWAFGIDDLIVAVGHHGPAVLGINWYRSMFGPDHDGTIHVDGSLSGGHAILTNRVDVKHERFFLSNSWGVGWGLNGGCWISFTDLDRLLHEDGEACIPISRERGR
jgi:hypothetical protein